VNALRAPGPGFRLRRAQSREVSLCFGQFSSYLLVLWLLGFSLHIAGSLIHLLLVVALIVLVINLVSGRRSVLRSGT
jgi:hypothetical protein